VGADSSAGGAVSSSATAVEGSSASQDRSVDFLQKYTNWLSIKLDYYTNYYSGRLSTYKLDRTIVTVGAPRILAMSTNPASAGASSCASACRLFCSNGSRWSTLLRSCGHHFFSSSGCGLRAPLRSRGLAL
jgi:hypothetical protein